MKPIRLLLVGGLVAAISLSGCTINVSTEGAHHSHEITSDSAEFSAADIMFIQMMLPHHQQAIDLGALAEAGDASPEVLELAKKIAKAQSHEVEHMEVWLEVAGATSHMGHDMAMPGMLTDAQIDQLKAAKGAEFDRLFLEGMIAHHEGAIQMAQDVLDSKQPDVAKMAADIVKTQTAEIEYMKELLAR